jgi:hypothetical protein
MSDMQQEADLALALTGDRSWPNAPVSQTFYRADVWVFNGSSPARWVNAYCGHLRTLVGAFTQTFQCLLHLWYLPFDLVE